MSLPTLGVCGMRKKIKGKPMQALIALLRTSFQVCEMDDDIILQKPAEEWPIVSCLIAFYSTGFPMDESLRYVELRKPVEINKLADQSMIRERLGVYRKLQEAGVPCPDFVFIDHPRLAKMGCEHLLEERDNWIEFAGRRINKPFVEKPLDGDDHSIHILYSKIEGGGTKKLFRKVGDKSSSFCPTEECVRRDGPYLYETFLPTRGTDIKVYTVGPEYCHAEARKAPTVDGKVERSRDGKEVRYPIILSAQEKMLANRISRHFNQFVCGFDVLRTDKGSVVCDVNGWSFVKGNPQYIQDAFRLIRQRFYNDVGFHPRTLRCLSATEGIVDSESNDDPGNDTPTKEATPGVKGGVILDEMRSVHDTACGKAFEVKAHSTCSSRLELRSVIVVLRHGDRRPKEKMKFKTKLPHLLRYFSVPTTDTGDAAAEAAGAQAPTGAHEGGPAKACSAEGDPPLRHLCHQSFDDCDVNVPAEVKIKAPEEMRDLCRVVDVSSREVEARISALEEAIATGSVAALEEVLKTPLYHPTGKPDDKKGKEDNPKEGASVAPPNAALDLSSNPATLGVAAAVMPRSSAAVALAASPPATISPAPESENEKKEKKEKEKKDKKEKDDERASRTPAERVDTELGALQADLNYLRLLRDVLGMHDNFSGLNRKVQLKRLKTAGGAVSSIQVVAKWGGELTQFGRTQSEELGSRLRQSLYPNDPTGLLRLHSSFRHDFKIYSSQEGRCQMTAASFTTGFLNLDASSLTPILVSLVTRDEYAQQLLDHPLRKEEREPVKRRIDDMLLSYDPGAPLVAADTFNTSRSRECLLSPRRCDVLLGDAPRPRLRLASPTTEALMDSSPKSAKGGASPATGSPGTDWGPASAAPADEHACLERSAPSEERRSQRELTPGSVGGSPGTSEHRQTLAERGGAPTGHRGLRKCAELIDVPREKLAHVKRALFLFLHSLGNEVDAVGAAFSSACTGNSNCNDTADVVVEDEQHDLALLAHATTLGPGPRLVADTTVSPPDESALKLRKRWMHLRRIQHRYWKVFQALCKKKDDSLSVRLTRGTGLGDGDGTNDHAHGGDPTPRAVQAIMAEYAHAKYDMSKIPDLWDNLYYDLLHHRGDMSEATVAHAEATFDSVSPLSAWINCSEYGIERREKLLIGTSVAWRLVGKMTLDLGHMRGAHASLTANEDGLAALAQASQPVPVRSGFHSSAELASDFESAVGLDSGLVVSGNLAPAGKPLPPPLPSGLPSRGQKPRYAGELVVDGVVVGYGVVEAAHFYPASGAHAGQAGAPAAPAGSGAPRAEWRPAGAGGASADVPSDPSWAAELAPAVLDGGAEKADASGGDASTQSAVQAPLGAERGPSSEGLGSGGSRIKFAARVQSELRSKLVDAGDSTMPLVAESDMVRSRIYVTSASSMHSLFNILLHGVSAQAELEDAEDRQSLRALFTGDMGGVTDLNYLSHIVCRCYEVRDGDDGENGPRFVVDVLISPGDGSSGRDTLLKGADVRKDRLQPQPLRTMVRNLPLQTLEDYLATVCGLRVNADEEQSGGSSD